MSPSGVHQKVPTFRTQINIGEKQPDAVLILQGFPKGPLTGSRELGREGKWVLEDPESSALLTQNIGG